MMVMKMDMREKKISGEIIYNGKIIRLEKDKVLCPNGKESYREVVRHNGGAAILCVTKNEEVLLIKQYRYPYDTVLYEIPAGKLELNEEPYAAALREFEEETGNKTDKLDFLGKIYPTCGYVSEILYLYLATDFEQSKTNFDDDELIETEFIPISKVKEMILSGEIVDAKTICAISYYLLKTAKF